MLRLRVLAGLLAGALDRSVLVSELRQAEARLASGARLAGLAYYEVDYATGRRLRRRPVLRHLRRPPGAAAGAPARGALAGAPASGGPPRVLDARERLHDGRLERLSIEYRYLHPDRGQRWIHHLAGVARRDAAGRAVGTYGVFRDITERKLAEEERSDLSRRLIRAHEDERALLARELHDDVTQRLAVLAIDAGRAELAAADEAQAAPLRAVREGLSRLSEDVHSLAYQLHPSVLEELGLVEALRTAGERFGRRGRRRALDGPRPGARRPREGRGALPVPRGPGGAEQRGPPRRGAHRERRPAAAWTAGCTSPSATMGSASIRPRPETRGRLGLASMRERVRLLNGTLEHRERARPWHGRRRPGFPAEEGCDEGPAAPAGAPRRRPPPGGRGAEEPARARVRAGGRGGGRAARCSRRPRRSQPDVIVADVTMPRLNGIDALVRLRQGGDRVPVVFLTMHRDVSFARRALEAGASGFVLKHSASVELVAAIRAALEGRTYLTPQLAGEVLEAMKQGPERAGDPIGCPHAEAAGGPPAPGGGALGEGDRLGPRHLDPDGGVPQVPDDGGAGAPHHRRAGPLRHQARARRALKPRVGRPGGSEPPRRPIRGRYFHRVPGSSPRSRPPASRVASDRTGPDCTARRARSGAAWRRCREALELRAPGGPPPRPHARACARCSRRRSGR